MNYKKIFYNIIMKNKILLYFIFGCLLSRIILVLIAKYINNKYLPYMSLFTLIIGVGFIYTSIINKKIGFFGSKIWWNNYRLIHSFNYILFSLAAYYKNRNSWIILLVDVLLGGLFFINKYYLNIF
jgi:hypothetical protein